MSCLVSPLQTGQAGFPHPAFPRILSPRHAQVVGVSGATARMSSPLSQGRFQELQPQGLQVGKERLPIRRSEGTLTTTLQVTNQSLHDKAVRTVESPSRVAIREVLAPTSQVASDLACQVIDRHESSAACRQFTHAIAKPGQRAFRGHHVEIASTTTKQIAIEAKRVA